MSLKKLNNVLLQGVRSGPVGEELNKSAAALDALHNKSQLHNIVGSLWQARQESSGSSLGNQVGYPFYVISYTSLVIIPYTV